MFKLIPLPKSVQYFDGKFFSFVKESGEKPNLPESILLELEQFAKLSGCFKFWENEKNFSVDLNGSDEEYGKEGSKINIDENGIRITAACEQGAFYACQTVKQIVLQYPENIPFAVIEDSPVFDYRAFMLDVGRYFYTVNEVKHFIDLMALHKLNVFHFHLTEDQGWRIEIKKYPLLTQKGSKRSHTNFGCIPRSGFYTQEEIKEIVRYAHSKHIKVVPEFDIPGHTVSAIACYPYLSCFDRKLSVATHWGVKHDILCAGKESTYRFVYDVLDEIAGLFPDGIIHIGGDEAFKMRWNICPNCQAEIEKNGLKDSEELQQLFMTKVNAYLQKKGIKTVMWNWDDIEPTKWLDPSIAWNLCGVSKEKLPVIRQEMKAGRNMILTSSFPYYLDFPFGWVDLKFAYEYNPIELFDEKDLESVWGIEAPLWTEYVPNMKKAHYMTFPRLAAVAENAWCKQEQKNWNDFLSRMDDYYKILALYDVKPASLSRALPSKLEGKATSLWFNRRVFHWQGLHNLIDDALVGAKAKKMKKASKH